MNLNVNQINYGLIKENNFITILCKKWLDDNDIFIYSTHNEGKSVVAKRFIKNLKCKIF